MPRALAAVLAEASLAAETEVLAAAAALATVLAAAAGLVLAGALAEVVPLLHPASAATPRAMAAEVPSVSFTVFMCSRLFVSGHQADNPETPVGSARLGPRPTNSGPRPRALASHADPKIIQELLGHSSIITIKSHEQNR